MDALGSMIVKRIRTDLDASDLKPETFEELAKDGTQKIIRMPSPNVTIPR